SAQWMRDSLPRFMGSKPAFFWEPLEAIAPSSQPYKLATLQVPQPARVVEAPPVVAAEPRAPVEAPRAPSPALLASATTVPRESAPLVRLAQAGAHAGATAPPPAASAHGLATPSTEEVEIMVARLV